MRQSDKSIVCAAVICTLIGALSAGCSLPKRISNTAGNANAATEASRNFGLMPLYPFRQDVWIGDIYLTTMDGDQWAEEVSSGMAPPLPVRLTRLDMDAPLRIFDKTRPQFESDTPAARKARSYTLNGRTAYLYPAAAPAMNLTSSKTFSAGVAGGIVDLLLLKLTGGYESEVAYSVSASELMSTGVPAYWLTAYNTWKGELAGQNVKTLLGVDAKVLWETCAVDEETRRRPVECHLHGVLMTEVFFAKKLNISATSTTGFAAGASGQASLSAKKLVSGAVDVVTGAVDGAATEVRGVITSVASEKNVPAPIVQELVSRIDTVLARTSSQASGELNSLATQIVDLVPDAVLPAMGDVSAQLAYVSKNGKSAQLVATFDEPVAIGYRGVAFDLIVTETGITVSGTSGKPAAPVGGDDVVYRDDR